MPKVEQLDWDKLQPKKSLIKVTHGTLNYATTKFIDNIRSKNGTLKVTSSKPTHPFKCSKCTFVANNRKELNDHWLLEHD